MSMLRCYRDVDKFLIRQSEVSNESMVDNGASPNITIKERENMTSLLNQAQEKLIKWKTKQ